VVKLDEFRVSFFLHFKLSSLAQRGGKGGDKKEAFGGLKVENLAWLNGLLPLKMNLLKAAPSH